MPFGTCRTAGFKRDLSRPPELNHGKALEENTQEPTVENLLNRPWLENRQERAELISFSDYKSEIIYYSTCPSEHVEQQYDISLNLYPEYTSCKIVIGTSYRHSPAQSIYQGGDARLILLSPDHNFTFLLYRCLAQPTKEG